MYDYQPPKATPEIIFCSDDLLIVNKPAGLLTVPGRRPEYRDCLLTRIQQNFPEALIVHRLDMSTSGLLVLARNNVAHRELSRQFEQRQVDKYYLALVTGNIVPATGQIELPLLKDWPNRPRQMVDQEKGKLAITDYRLLNYDPLSDTSRVELRPLTGRTHQLRVHMQALGHPILGDDLYADLVTLKRADRLMLHAWKLCFTDPVSGKQLFFSAEAPF